MPNRPEPSLQAVRDQCLCLQVRKAARAAARHYDAALAPTGLTNGQFALLALLAGNALLGMGALAQELGMDRSTLIAALKPLTERGLVRVEVDDADRRARVLSLAPPGRHLLQAALPLWAAAQADMISRVGRADLARLRGDLASLAR